MARYEELYDLLLDYANLRTEVEQVFVGLNWTVCLAGAVGIAPTRRCQEGGLVDRSAPLQGRSLAELSQWLRSWDSRQASIGLAAVNAAINREADMVYMEGALFKGRQAFQGSFDWFVPRLRGQNVVVSGPGIHCLRDAGVSDLIPLTLPEAITPEAEQLIPKADWLFIPADTIADKTLPRLLELAEGATCVLYGTEVPWLDEWGDFGVDYLIGSQIDSPRLLNTLVAEGADRQDLVDAVSYRVISYNGASQHGLTTSKAFAGRALHLV